MTFNHLNNFLSRSEYDHATGCINYAGPVGDSGYGQVTTCGGVRGNPHVIVFILYYQRHPKSGDVVMHNCNNSRCVHPLHLEEGTQTENVLKMYRDGRRTNCLLEHEVLAIRQEYLTTNISQLELATKYNTVEQSIRKLLKGETYEWISNPCKDKYEELTNRRVLVRRGQSHANSKLTEASVREIRRLKQAVKISNMRLARQFKVSDRTIEDILHRRTWKHLT